MRTITVKWVSIAALLVTLVFWNSAANYQPALNVVVSTAAAVIAIQAAREKKYGWATGFVAMVLLFNPAVPVFRLSGGLGFFLVVLSIAPFAVSLAELKPRPLLSVPSITGRTPGSESL